jgi:hypothetical protein
MRKSYDLEFLTIFKYLTEFWTLSREQQKVESGLSLPQSSLAQIRSEAKRWFSPMRGERFFYG